MIGAAVAAAARALGSRGDATVEIGIENGAALAEGKTMNGRLGVKGGLSVLGTTGVVTPYSCSAWIAAIHRGIDVARAAGHRHVAAATGRASEAAVRARYGLPETALIDMGDFAGGVLKYLRRRPVARLSLAGGFAKMCKLAQGYLDLHSARGQVDTGRLADALAGARRGAGDGRGRAPGDERRRGSRPSRRCRCGSAWPPSSPRAPGRWRKRSPAPRRRRDAWRSTARGGFWP